MKIYLYLPLQNKTYTNQNTVFIYLLILYTDVTYKLQLQLHTITIIYTIYSQVNLTFQLNHTSHKVDRYAWTGLVHKQKERNNTTK